MSRHVEPDTRGGLELAPEAPACPRPNRTRLKALAFGLILIAAIGVFTLPSSRARIYGQLARFGPASQREAWLDRLVGLGAPGAPVLLELAAEELEGDTSFFGPPKTEVVLQWTSPTASRLARLCEGDDAAFEFVARRWAEGAPTPAALPAIVIGADASSSSTSAEPGRKLDRHRVAARAFLDRVRREPRSPDEARILVEVAAALLADTEFEGETLPHEELFRPWPGDPVQILPLTWKQLIAGAREAFGDRLVISEGLAASPPAGVATSRVLNRPNIGSVLGTHLPTIAKNWLAIQNTATDRELPTLMRNPGFPIGAEVPDGKLYLSTIDESLARLRRMAGPASE